MASGGMTEATPGVLSQSAFVRGFIDGGARDRRAVPEARQSQSAFVRGFIDGAPARPSSASRSSSQSAFVRGFIDGPPKETHHVELQESQSAFVRGFIDGGALSEVWDP